jgi:formylglycine-generating enzyme required for sulfatase activity
MRYLLAAGLALLLARLTCLSAVPVPAETEPRVDPVRHKSYTETVPATKVTFEMMAIPGGVYWRGSPPTEDGRRVDEGPAHPVEIRPFWMAKYETTWDLFDLYLKGSPPRDEVNEAARKRDPDAITRPTPPYIDETYGYGREGYSVIGISHHLAMEFCHWLARKTGKPYRLPTEAEWEWACRAGTTAPWSFGNESGKLDEYAWYAKNSEDVTHPVGKKKANPWGLHDMHGNVAEWCLDHYKQDRYAGFALLKPSLGPVELPTADRYSHVVRGGCFADEALQCRGATRRGSDTSWNRHDPGRPQSIWWLSAADFVGFRIACAVEEQENLRGIRSKVTRQSR